MSFLIYLEAYLFVLGTRLIPLVSILSPPECLNGQCNKEPQYWK